MRIQSSGGRQRVKRRDDRPQCLHVICVDEHVDSQRERVRHVLVRGSELGHHAHRDVWRLLGITALTLAAGMAGAWLAVRELSPDGPGHLTSLPSLALGLLLWLGYR